MRKLEEGTRVQTTPDINLFGLKPNYRLNGFLNTS